MENKKTNRRKMVKGMAATAAAMGAGLAGANAMNSKETKANVTHGDVVMSQDVPLFSGHTTFNNLVFISGKGAHFDGDIKSHTDHVLNELEKELKKAGSSMEQVLKVNVYLHDLNDYKGMNEVFRGRFGAKPGVRTTVATYAGVPGDSLVEIDCIAYKE